MDISRASVIVPVYNGEAFLESTLRSILGQDYENLEVVVIDDCSNDGSREVINLFETKINKVILNKKNVGVSESRNIGILETTGDYIFFVDQDDNLPQSFISNFLKCANDCDVVQGGLCCVDSHGKISKKYTPVSKDIKTFPLNIYTRAYKKDFILQNYIFFDGRFGEDCLFSTKALLLAKSISLCCNTHYLWNTAGTCSRKVYFENRKNIKEWFSVQLKIIFFLNSSNFISDAYQSFRSRVIERLEMARLKTRNLKNIDLIDDALRLVNQYGGNQ